MASRLAYLFFAISLCYAALHHTIMATWHKLLISCLPIASILLTLGSIITLGTLLFGLLSITPLQAILIRCLSRPIRALFRMLPKDHPALAFIALNLSSNLIGVSNAATPSGIEAMRALQASNPDPKRATDAMCLLLALNTSSVQLLPLTVIGILTATGNQHPWHWWPYMLLATSATTVFALSAAYCLSAFSRRRRT